MGAAYVLCVSEGTTALMCALAGLGIRPGDEVIIPTYTYIATASAVLAVGAEGAGQRNQGYNGILAGEFARRFLTALAAADDR